MHDNKFSKIIKEKYNIPCYSVNQCTSLLGTNKVLFFDHKVIYDLFFENEELQNKVKELN